MVSERGRALVRDEGGTGRTYGLHDATECVQVGQAFEVRRFVVYPDELLDKLAFEDGRGHALAADGRAAECADRGLDVLDVPERGFGELVGHGVLRKRVR